MLPHSRIKRTAQHGYKTDGVRAYNRDKHASAPRKKNLTFFIIHRHNRDTVSVATTTMTTVTDGYVNMNILTGK